MSDEEQAANSYSSEDNPSNIDPSGQVPNVTREELDGAAVNPFAPVQTSLPPTSGTSRVNLPIAFWAWGGVAALLFSGLLFLQPFFGIVGLLALVAAVVRVPAFQRYKTRRNPNVELPRPVPLLATSWLIMLVCGFAAFVAFCMVCIPAGVFTFSVMNESPSAVSLLFCGSGFIGLAAFIYLFRLSLRLPR